MAFVELSLAHLNKDSIVQYQTEERTLVAFRLASARYRIKALLDIMSKDMISTAEKRDQLKKELSEYYSSNPAFKKCTSMGQIVKTNLKQTLRKNLLLIPKIQSRFED
jgi:hypothetical protein